MKPKVITISIEGLASSLLGPYGANTAVTPTVDALSAHGIVLDQCFLDGCSTPDMLLSLWTAQHTLRRELSSGETLWQLLQSSGGEGILITDCPETAEFAEKTGCQGVVLVDPPEITEPVQEISRCSILSLFAEAAEVIDDFSSQPHDRPLLVWIHSRGLRLPWDAPIALRKKFADPEDPEPPSGVQPPRFEVTAETDPDDVVGWGQVAAAQVAVIDQAIELLHDYLSQSEQYWAWCLLGLSGIPLGEHSWFGLGKTELYGEELHVPVLIVPNPPLPVGTRRAELCQLPDIGATIAQLCGLVWSSHVWGIGQLEWRVDDTPIHWPASQQTIGLADGDQFWIRVPAWSLVFSEDNRNQLFVKPDDRWEVSEVSIRCVDIVNELRRLAEQFFQAAKGGSRGDLIPLNEKLCDLLR